MSKKRVISSKTRSSQNFASLTYRQRDLWHGLITVADDQGRLPGTPAYIRSQVWPYDDVKLDEVASDLSKLVDIESIVIYQFDGSCYLQIVNWWKYQGMQWAGKSDYLPPKNWNDRERYHGKGNEIFTNNWEGKGGFSILPSELPSELPSDESYTAREGEVKIKEKVKKEAQEAPDNETPKNLDEWLELLTDTKNPNADLMFMFETLYPRATQKPSFGYLGKVSKQVGGAGRLAHLLWQCSSAQITGDVMRYVQGYHKNHKDEKPKKRRAQKPAAEVLEDLEDE